MLFLQKIQLGFALTCTTISWLPGVFGLSYPKIVLRFFTPFSVEDQWRCHQLFLGSLLLPERIGQPLQCYSPSYRSNNRYPEQFPNVIHSLRSPDSNSLCSLTPK